MYSETITKIYDQVTTESAWKAWADVNSWPKWDTELVCCDLKASFESGAQFILKPKGGPKVKITLTEVVPSKKFTATCRFLGATMTHIHAINPDNGKLAIKHIISVTGPLAFVWKHLVVKNVVKAVPVQTDNMINYINRGAYE